MQEFLFYVQLGLDHVLDVNAYDHVLFLAALAAPFTFKSWKKVLLLASVFTVAHCLSLTFSAYDVFKPKAEIIEFLIPVTIFLTALFNIISVIMQQINLSNLGHLAATTFFGLVHGFGFSNYFNMLMAEEENKIIPLLGFATGIELSQIIVVLIVLLITSIFLFIASLIINLIKKEQIINIKTAQSIYIVIISVLVIVITIPMLIETFPVTNK